MIFYPALSVASQALKGRVLWIVSALALCFFALFAVGETQAQGIETRAKEAYLVDFETGTVLLDKKGEERMAPSSMSKLMTAVMVFERLQEGSLSLDDMFQVSENAWRVGGAASGGSTMFLEPNTRVRLEDLIRGMITQSGNDACIVIAENLMGSEAAFADAATKRGREIGLKDSNFTNSTGLPDPDHYTTPQDLVTLSHYIIETFPQYYKYYSEKEFTYNGKKQGNRNPLLYAFPGADGLKTGHTSVAGYGLTGSAVSGNRRLILVINGLPTMKARSEEAIKLMDWGFRNFENKRLFTAGETVTTADVWLGEEKSVPLTLAKDLKVTLPRRAALKPDVRVSYTSPVPAPVSKGTEIGTLHISGPDMAEPINIPLVAAQDVEKIGFFGRAVQKIKVWVFGFASGRSDSTAEKK